MKGTLYIVATPIGNLGDITYRAVDILKNCAFILTEDTRVSATLMRKYEISTQLISYRDQNHNKIINKIIEKLSFGLNLALISDAGTPLISDPGYRLVKEIVAGGYSVQSIPGASAVVSALSISGLPTDRFTFLGFLPKSDSQISKILKEYGANDSTLLIYESPNRLLDLLTKINLVLGNRQVSVHNDLTKLFEKSWYGDITAVLTDLQNQSLKGEFVVCVAKASVSESK